MTASLAMTDTELRGLVLRAFYERRMSRAPQFPDTSWLSEETTISELYRICKQLGEHGLITWSPFTGDGGIGEITAHGIDVIEGQRQSDIAVHLVHNYTTNISGSTNVIVGDNNRQAVSASFEELLRAVNSYPGSDADKEESKNLLAQLAKSPVFAQVVGQLTRFGLEHLAK
jgi:hypothetical protein